MTKKSYTKKRLFIDNFSSMQNKDNNEYDLELCEPKTCFNVKENLGTLVCTNGLIHLKLPISQSFVFETNMRELSGITFSKIWHYKYFSRINNRYEYILVAYASDKKLYYTNIFFADDSFHKIDITVNSEPSAINFIVSGDDVIGFSSLEDDFLVWYCDANPYSVTTAPRFISICMHKQRLFVIDAENDNLVRFNSKTDPMEWTTSNDGEDAGTIEMNDYKGHLKNLLSFGDYVYVFRDNGISKIISYSSDSLYSVSNVYSSSRIIYCSTACVCEDKIYFLQEDGLYEFDGSKVEKVDLKFSSMLNGNSQEFANTCFYDGKLYISCKLNFDDNTTVGCESGSFKNNCLMEFDPKTKKYNITRGVDICCMIGLTDLFVNKLIVLQNSSSFLWQLDKTGILHNTVLPKKWESGKITLSSYSTNKILKEIRLKCSCSCNIKIECENRIKTFSLVKSEKITRLVCLLSGKEFKLTISSNDNELSISNLEMIFIEES
ncbi:MAG: hypothetical protein EOM55_01295 [Clostridia bacterium]|nr:hypothetical protein [Clostridia bacterium]